MIYSEMMSKTVSVRVPLWLYKSIEAFAEKKGLKFSDAAREYLAAGDKKLSNVSRPNEFIGFLRSLGYDRISDIPDSALDNVTGEYLAWKKGKRA